MRLLTLKATFFNAALLATTLGTGFSAATWADPCCLPPEHTLFTQGHGEIKAVPDAVSFTARTEATASSVADAQKKAQGRMAQVIATLHNAEKSLVLSKPLKLQTQAVQVVPVYDEKSKSHKLIAYKSSNSLKITVAGLPADKLSDAGSALIDAATRAGADEVAAVTFFVDDMEAPKLKALGDAVQSARRNADIMSKGLGIVLKGLQSVEGSPQYNYQPMYRAEFAMMKAAPMADAAPSTPVEVGEITVTCDVSVRYLIQN